MLGKGKVFSQFETSPVVLKVDRGVQCDIKETSESGGDFNDKVLLS